MTTKLSDLSAPALAGVVKEKTVRAAIAEMRNAMYDGADMIDLHLSTLDDTGVVALKEIISSLPLPTLALNYSNFSKETAEEQEPERVASLLRAAEAGAAGIDMQGYTFCQPSKLAFVGENKYSFTRDNPKEVVTDSAIISKQCELIERVHSMGAEVLLSCHPGVYMNREQVVELALFLEKRSPDIIKIVIAEANTEEQMAECFATMVALKKEIKTPVTFHANGKCGALTRIINPVLGGHIAFCVSRFNEESTMGQLDLRTAAAAVDSLFKISKGGI